MPVLHALNCENLACASGHSSISWTRRAGLISDQDNPDTNDLQVELYSLGTTLYEMLTGTLPSAAADPLEWRVTGPTGTVGISTGINAKNLQPEFLTDFASLCA